MKLQEELKRPVAFATLQQEALVNLLRIGDQLENQLSRFFREHGLTLSRFNVLRILSLDQRPLTCGEIAERMVQVVPAITSLVDHLEQQGLVQRQRCTDDRRVVHVQITPNGRDLCEQTMVPLSKLEKDLLKQLSSAELKSLIGLAEKIRGSLADCAK